MSFKKNRRPQLLSGGLSVGPVQSLTTASTGTTVTNDGVTTIATTAGAKVFKLAKPDRVGQLKRVVAILGTTGDATLLAGPSTASVFSGSTLGRLTFSTGAGKYRSVELIGASTTAWLIGARSTGVVPGA